METAVESFQGGGVGALGRCCEVSRDSNRTFFHVDASNDTCVLHNENAPDFQVLSASCVSGYVGWTPGPPPPPPVGTVDIIVNDDSLLSSTAENFLCWNLDASRNRQFFDRNLSQAGVLGAQLAYQAAAIGSAQIAGYSWLRFGGSGNDYLTYEFNGTLCDDPGSAYKECLNETVWNDVLAFTEAANAKMIFGLSMNTHEDRRLRQRGGEADDDDDPFPAVWDSSNAREILSWTIAQGRDDLIGGFELGNEQDSHYSADQIAGNFGVLWELVQELWPDDGEEEEEAAPRRPLLFGPDPHSCKQDGCADKTLQWITDFLNGTLSRGVPIHAVTHHEYIEVDDTTWTSPAKLDVGESIAVDINATVDAATQGVSPRVWRVAGEIGPHNGGSPVCDHTSMRWAVFGDSLWYADSLALKARHGYDLHCRQDFIGADYGLLDCSTGEPLPDYFTGLVWSSVMGAGVLEATVKTENATSVRAYVHCSRDDGGVAALLINLGSGTVNASLWHADGASPLGGASGSRVRYTLEGSQDKSAGFTDGVGLQSTAILLNGVLLELDEAARLPSLAGANEDLGSTVTLVPQSLTFVTFPDADVAACLSTS